MLRFALLAGAMALTAPAFAQDMPARDQPAQAAPSAPSAPTAVDQAVPSSSAPAEIAPATPAETAAASGTQVAEIVNSEFASYDKNGDGSLSAAEFDAWMVALKTASDPSTKASAPATRTWLTKAFAQADTDKNKTVSKTELTGFLSQQG